MSQQTINRGSSAGDTGAENAYDAFGKVNDNFTEIYNGTALITGLNLYESGAGTNAKRWEFSVDSSGTLYGKTLTDAGVQTDDFLKVQRSGTDVTQLDLYGGLGVGQLVNFRVGPTNTCSVIYSGPDDTHFVVRNDAVAGSGENGAFIAMFANDSTQQKLTIHVCDEADNIFNRTGLGPASPGSAIIVNCNGTTVGQVHCLIISNSDIIPYSVALDSGVMTLMSPAYSQSASAPAIADNGTITTASVGVARLAPAAARTGIIMQAGTVAGQKVTVINQSTAANTITMAAAGTSNVSNGTSCVIAGLKAMSFTWNSATSLWYPEA